MSISVKTYGMIYIYNNFIYFFFSWLEHVREVASPDNTQEDQAISWAAHHATMQNQEETHRLQCRSALLTLFHDQAKSVAMIRHPMDVVREAVEILNPGQVSNITVDQPL